MTQRRAVLSVDLDEWYHCRWATGSPREVTITVSPARTSRRILEKCRLASAAETVFMAWREER